MYKVFLVEDEVIIREGLRSSIPWEQCGFSFVGDAPDGELALPLIRHCKPDLLITDIKMPFMDGLALSQRVHQELPDTRIIIISGYDDFQYARQAIEIGVEQYLLKPITKTALMKALEEVRDKLDAEEEQRSYVEQFRQEAREYEHFSRRRFFERLVLGQTPVSELYNDAQKLDIDLSAQSYNIVLYSVYQHAAGSSARTEQYSAQQAQCQQELELFFLRCPQFLLFRWSLTVYAVLIRSRQERIDFETQFCVQNIRRQFEAMDDRFEWYVAAGSPVERLSYLHDCFEEASRILSYRHLCVGQHILTRDSLNALNRGDTETHLKELDISKMSPEILRNFMKNGSPEETGQFVEQYLDSIGRGALDSMLFSQYVMLNVRFTAAAFVESLNHDQSELTDAVDSLPSVSQMFGAENVERYITRLLSRAVELRESADSTRYHEVVKQGLRYIDQHYTEPTISLNEVACGVKISANYFSALFSQEMGCTFVEYLTRKRMEKAKELLRSGNMRTGDIALAVGFKDAHYFSYLFRKTQGCTPRDYRGGRQ